MALVDRLLAAGEHDAAGIEHVVVVDDDVPEWSALLASDDLAAAPAAQPADLATLIYTSRTTGPPKGVELTHANVLTMAGDVARLIGEEHLPWAVLRSRRAEVSEFFHHLEPHFEPGKSDVTLEKVLVDGDDAVVQASDARPLPEGLTPNRQPAR